MVKKKPLSERQQRIADAKLKGLKNKDIGLQEYPQANPDSQAVLVSRELRKPNVAQYVAKELGNQLEEYGVTKNQYLINLGLAMQAMRSTITGEVVVDFTTRLSANKMAERFLKFDEPENKVNDSELAKALSDPNITEVELNRMTLRK